MPNDLASRAHAILTRALGVDRARREEVVVSACAGDAALEQRVRRLLKAADDSEEFLASPALGTRAGRSAGLAGGAPVPVPDAVGTYLVVGVLGSGGMATVYEALQENPNRRVALKVMHQTMTHTDALLRFRLEAQTLARLHHPGIAQIFEAGTAQLGQPRPSPFFAMELVPDALSITEYARRNRLPLRDRLEMFAGVCDAVLHGHQNGVIHRDLKPANVLVGPDARAKVIDFGIARTVSGGASGTGDQTASLTGAHDARRIIGTLNAMSPEQCTDPSTVDVRTDVYSLGVILYELVTDRPPHDLSECTIPAAVRVITQDSAIRAGQLNAAARGDLEAIIGKAMEKDRAARYTGAGALAADIRRYLNNQTVEARKPTAFEHARKFVRRNPPLAIAIAAAALLLVGGAAASASFAYLAARARDAALQRERDLEVVVGFQDSMIGGIDVPAMGERLRAALADAVKHANADTPEGGTEVALRQWNRLTERVNFTTLAVETVNQSVLRRYTDSINTQFADRPLIRARLLQSLAGTMHTLGLSADARPVVREALRIRREELGPDHIDTLYSLHTLGNVELRLGGFDDAVAALGEAHAALTRTLGPDHPATLRVGTSLGGAHRRHGNLGEAERLWADTLKRQRRVLGDDDPSTLRTLNNMGVLYAVQGRLDEAEACWRELLERRRRISGVNDAEYRGLLGNLGSLLADRGKFEEAKPLIERALEADRARYGDAHPSTLTSMSQMAWLLRDMKDYAGAERFQRAAAEGRLAVLGSESPDTLRARGALARILAHLGENADAERMIHEVLGAQRRILGSEHPDTLESLGSLRDMLQACGRSGEALEISIVVVDAAARAPAGESIALGRHLLAHGGLLLDAGSPDAAVAPLTEAYHLLSGSLGAAHPEVVAAAARLTECHHALHELDPGAGHDREAASWSVRAGARPRRRSMKSARRDARPLSAS